MSLIEEITAVNDTYNIIQEYGQTVQLVKQSETTRQVDKFGSPKKVVETSIIELKAFPIRYKPSVKEIREAGFNEGIEVLFYVSKKEMDDKSVVFDILRDRIRIANEQYKISDQAPNGHIGNSFRSWILGLVKE